MTSLWTNIKKAYKTHMDARLIEACARDRADKIDGLVWMGANIHARDDKALRDSVAMSRIETALKLLSYGGVKKETLTHIYEETAKTGKMDLFQAIEDYDAENGAVLGSKPAAIQSTLKTAIYYDNPKIVAHMLDRYKVKTAEALSDYLDYARKQGGEEIIGMLEKRIFTLARQNRHKTEAERAAAAEIQKPHAKPAAIQTTAKAAAVEAPVVICVPDDSQAIAPPARETITTGQPEQRPPAAAQLAWT